MSEHKKNKSGFVALVGRPNVGKSTLMNNLVGQKVAITSSKPQTTRDKISGIYTTDHLQVVFVDTPGIFKPHLKLDDYMDKASLSSLNDVDLVLFLVEPEAINSGDNYIVNLLKQVNVPVFLVINKVDQVNPNELLPIIDSYQKLDLFKELLPISATKGIGISDLVATLRQYLPEGPEYYNSDEITDRPEYFLVAELIREQILRLTSEEVPHAAAVWVERMNEHQKGKLQIEATIYVEKSGQKGIIIGKGGQMLKQIGINARKQIENLLGEKVNLHLWVKVQRNWRSDPSFLKQVGYDKKGTFLMPRELKEVQGIIFKRQKYKEADLLAKIMTKELGIVTLIARGALKPKSKLGAATVNFSIGQYVIYTSGQGLSNLRTYKDVKQFSGIFADLTKNAYASFILDLVDHAFSEYQNLGKYYDLTLFALKKVDQGIDPEMISQVVQMQLLAAYGVEPELKHCVICGCQQGEFDYSIKLGGILCSKHFYRDNSRLHLTAKATAVLRTIGLVPFNRLGTIKVNRAIKQATRKAIDRIYQETIDLNLKSKKFLDEINLLD